MERKCGRISLEFVYQFRQDAPRSSLRDLDDVVLLSAERWCTPAGATVVAPLPPGLVGGFGPHLRRGRMAAHVQGQVTSERLTAMLSGLGLPISKRQVVRLLSGPLDRFVAEDQAVLRAGLSSAAWISIDDTAARHARADGVTTQIGDARFTAFRTGSSKSRLNFLALRAEPGTGTSSSTTRRSPICAAARSPDPSWPCSPRIRSRPLPMPRRGRRI